MSTPHAAATGHGTVATRRRAPGPRGVPFLGSAPEVMRRGQVRYFRETWERYGDLVRMNVGPFVSHVVVHPDHVRHVLATRHENYAKGPGYAKTKDLLGNGLLTGEGDLW